MTLPSSGGSLRLSKGRRIKDSCDMYLIDSLELQPITEVDKPYKVACDELLCRPNSDQQCDAVLERHDGLLKNYKVLTANCVQTLCVLIE